MKTTQQFRPNNAPHEADSATLDDLLDRWEIARERGEEISLEELCEEAPHLLGLLREQVNRLLEIDGRLDLDDPEGHSGATLEEIDARSSYGRLKLHATGGLGAVYAAEDLRLHRQVALKFLRQKLLSDRMSRGMFEMEAEITSRLEHPGIVPVYGLGETHDGRTFYAMRFIQGRTLDAAITSYHTQAAEHGIDPHDRAFRSLLTHYVALCKTIAYAHTRGIIHRDIKPANVMLGRYGETLVVDWGLAMSIGRTESFKHHDEVTLKPSGSSRIHSSTGIVGTPAFMSPEQLSGSTSLQPATDIYSLGATLYKLLTGRIPVDGATLSEVQQRVIRGTYARPTALIRTLPKPLEAICLKAMAVEPGDRYVTALELADDVERYMSDDAVEAYAEPIGRRAARWARRHRRPVQVAAAAALALIALTLLYSARTASFAKQQEQARLEAEGALRDALGSEARTLAAALQYQIERRLDAIELAAADPELSHAVTTLAEADLSAAMIIMPDDARQRYQYLTESETTRDAFSELEKDLESIRLHWHRRRGFENASWFVILDNGLQVGRAPIRKDDGSVIDSLGGYYGYRQYFRGGEPTPPDGAGNPMTPPSPIRQSFLAAPHESTNGGAMVTFTTPVRAPAAEGEQGQVVGVLGMAVPAFELTSLDQALAQSSNHADNPSRLTIAYLRPDYYNRRRTGEGLILQHDAFRSHGDEQPLLDAYQACYLSEATRRRISETRDDGMVRAIYDVITDYEDPLAERLSEYEGAWLAAIAPVVAEQNDERDATCSETGWTVILQRRP